MASNYWRLALAVSVNAIVMYFIMYVMISSIDHFYVNINRVYMALLMAAPMVVVMLSVMSSMFSSRRANTVIYLAMAGVIVLIYALIRTQTPVGDAQFLRSMIPHHSGAILMCEKSRLTDPEVKKLCEQIIKSQKEEIGQMEAILKRY